MASAATPRTTVRNRDAHQKPTECAAGTTGNRATRPRIKTACFIRSSWCLIMGSRTCTPRRHVSTSCSTRVLSQRRYRPHTARRSLLRVRPPLEDIRFSDLRLYEFQSTPRCDHFGRLTRVAKHNAKQKQALDKANPDAIQTRPLVSRPKCNSQQAKSGTH